MAPAGSASLHRKTKLCNFFMVGACAKKDACNFAHGLDELKPEPDLRFTKLCPKLASGGTCDGSNCTFAHHKGELRKFPREKSNREQQCLPSGLVAAEELPAEQPPPVPAPSSGSWRGPRGPVLLTRLGNQVLQITEGAQPEVAGFQGWPPTFPGAPFLMASPKLIPINATILADGTLGQTVPSVDQLSVRVDESLCSMGCRPTGKCFARQSATDMNLAAHLSRPTAPGSVSGSSSSQPPSKAELPPMPSSGSAAGSVAALPELDKYAPPEATTSCLQDERPALDLQSSRLCPALLVMGTCSDSHCRYSHGPAEHSDPVEYEVDDESLDVAPLHAEEGAEDCTADRPDSPTFMRDETESGTSEGRDVRVSGIVQTIMRQLSVKNTFLTFESEPPEEPQARRSRSAPCLVVHEEEEEEDEAAVERCASETASQPEVQAGSPAAERRGGELGVRTPRRYLTASMQASPAAKHTKVVDRGQRRISSTPGRYSSGWEATCKSPWAAPKRTTRITKTLPEVTLKLALQGGA